MEIQDLLQQAESRKASDLHLVTSCKPILRIDGALQPMDDAPDLTAEKHNNKKFKRF